MTKGDYTILDAPTPPQSGRDARKDAKVELAAAKARARAERPFWKKPWVWVVGIIVLAAIASAAGTSSDSDDPSNSDTADSGDSDDAAGIGSQVSDGKFTFTVHSFECGDTKIGNGPLAEKAQGQFCVAEVTVECDEAQLMDSE